MADKRGATLALVVGMLALVGCGTGNRLDTQGDGPGGGQNLPVINQVDSGEIGLTDGLFNGDGNDLVLTDPASNASVRLPDQAVVSSNEQGYDLDGDGDLDILVITMRSLSAQAAASVANDTLSPSMFTKVGGVALLPMDVASTLPMEVVVPVHPNFTADTLSLYKYTNNYITRNPTQDIGTDSGTWELLSITTVENSGGYATFSISLFGEYAVVAEHDQGSGGSV